MTILTALQLKKTNAKALSLFYKLNVSSHVNENQIKYHETILYFTCHI